MQQIQDHFTVMLGGIRAGLENWIIQKKAIASTAELKRVRLTGYMSIICIVVAIIYACLDTAYKVYYSYPAYIVLFVMPTCSLFLIRRQHYKMAKVTLIISANLVVFWSALHDPFETGVFLFFIPAGIGSFVILASKDVKTAIGLLLFTTVLFVISHFADHSLFRKTELSGSYVQISFLFNFFISLSVSVSAVYFLMTLNKLSEIELMEKEILTNNKNLELQKVNAELDNFVYRVSHDLRSPLSSILGLTNLARLTDNPAEINKILEMIQGRVNAQDTFIREIIHYSRNARTELSIQDVNLHEVIDNIIEDLKFMAIAEKIEFRKNLPDNSIIKTDRMRLWIILSNLIGNAIKYHDLNKEHPFVEIGYHKNLSCLYVKDNGTGIDPDVLGNVFNMFYRGSDRSTGSGLGLFIAQEAAARIGGTIEVESVYAEGSIFRVCLGKRDYSHTPASEL